MKGIRLLSTIFLLLFVPLNSSMALDPKTGTIVLNAAYGTVGGSLLGVASLAFGGRGKLVAKGASIGLYMGLAFGVYVVASHSYKMGQEGEDAGDDEEMGRSFFDFGGGGTPKTRPKDTNPRYAPNLFYITLFQYRF